MSATSIDCEACSTNQWARWGDPCTNPRCDHTLGDPMQEGPPPPPGPRSALDWVDGIDATDQWHRHLGLKP